MWNPPPNGHESDTLLTRRATKVSPELKAFYDSHNVHGLEDLLNAEAAEQRMRFVRLNPRHDKADTLSLLENELPENGSLVPIPLLDERFGFYAVPGNFSIAQSQAFRSGRIYGMDVSSGAAVAALQLPDGTDGCRVLDLCCSPGLKLCMMADLLSSSKSTIVGVDVSDRRLALCKSIVKKYQVDSATSGHAADDDPSGRPRIRLYRADGTKFDNGVESELVFDSVVAIEEHTRAGKRKRMNKSARARERKRLRQLSSLDKMSSSEGEEESTTTIEPFDRVLVDAECSTDGSLKHVQQRVLKQASDGANNPTLTDPKQLESLVELQKGLISSGFKLLKPEGILVYSTCSLSVEQNEGVVQWLLENYKEAFVIPVSFPFAERERVVEGSLEGTVRFLPSITVNANNKSGPQLHGGGFFVAKIGKRIPETPS